ncbi:zinc ribbon domain-containing protein [Calidifontibacter indicus]|uniref:zinc ribbon domain-containing protein n=1 Tax=Calidifontibacter indicus TaxID=419650 RepID=UPI003D753F0F
MNADLAKQWRMLDLQALDTRLTQLAHKKRTLPVLAELETATKQQAELFEEVVLARTAAQDVEREITKAEDAVQLVRDRAARNQQRLDAGQGSPKDLQGMQHELETLARRQAELEDEELAVMERAEELRATLARREAQKAEVDEKIVSLTNQRDEAIAEIDKESNSVAAQRDQVAPGLGADLLGLYEKVREQCGGLAAAALTQRRCGGCGLELNASELARFRNAPENEILRCEDCRRIVVRTSESGL